MNITHSLRGDSLRKLLVLMLYGCILCISFSAMAGSQGDIKVTLSFRDAPLNQVFKGIERQTGLVFMYNTNQVQDSYRVSINVKETALSSVFKNLLSPRGITWEFRMKTVVLKPEKTEASANLLPPDSAAGRIVTGEVRDINGTPLPGAFIYIKATRKGTISNEKGAFTLNNVPHGAVLLITYTGYVPQQISASGNSPLHIQMDIANNKLDEAVVMAYGVTSRRLNTGSISKVTAEEIGRQPISNPLATLEGRVPGMLVTQSSGAPGASVKVQIRGQNSLINGTEPLYIIDGIPFAPNNNNLNNVSSLLTNGNGAGLSPFSMINPADIESIEVLKDADATAIYGSRGANGVVLITTKRGKPGLTSFQAIVNGGLSKVTRSLDMLNTQQYIAIRKEAFKNDGITPSAIPGSIGYAPDLMIWDTTRYTDIQKLLLGGTAKVYNATLSLSGGNASTQFLVSGTLHRETSVFPADGADSRPSLNFNLSHTSLNRKLTISLAAISSFDNNTLPAASGFSILSPPNIPSLYDSTGQLNWQEKGIPFHNPLGDLEKKYTVNSNNYLTRLNLNYKLLPNLTVAVNAGFNIINTKETQTSPILSQDPVDNPTGTSTFSNGNIKSWIIEPQINYTTSLLKGKLDALVGSTLQDNKRDFLFIMATGYTSDNLLGSLAAAPNISYKTSNDVKYRYQAVFGRLNYIYSDKYIINLTGRRDGSSRFGPGKRFSNFGSAGVAWIFSNEKFISPLSSVLSYGKLRGSYGVTGNDQIGDYQYLPSWSSMGVPPYQGTPALRPDILFNPNFSWERNKKLEISIDLGLWKDKILLSANIYKNRSDNQLVNAPLPGQTGFYSILENLPAVIINKGTELDLTVKMINKRDLKWSVNGNITIPSNRLESFPGLSISGYANQYEVGKSINIIRAYKQLGVDPKTGLFTFEDLNNDGSINIKDLQTVAQINPSYYGGIGTEIRYKNFQLNILVSFRKQVGKNYRADLFSNYYPGMMYNQPTAVLDRWQNTGDIAPFEKFTSITYSDAYAKALLYRLSSGTYSDASFVRIKNISITYSLPQYYLKKVSVKDCKLFLQAANLFTITNYIGDPETQSIFNIPTMRTITGGIQVAL
ncbi:SusC/RagA family TonB-linked outer membrane protein [Chitinophaga oryzae]|uniref:SusC/RagA family TonB-linked outer membrane protein n=1 Tax=Chitinophaga oryzae TaxID=2725414 RepID=A0ABX6LBX6_9BACT|nr:SusC/RagA family TonB-linked outer membrane protein [Chitinophaga oryzae]QJB37309.1 SusC/RagA family TonB-linked outer membrane protein [Chitinophaga oryzae]